LAREALGSDEGLAPSDSGDESVLDRLPAEGNGEQSAEPGSSEAGTGAEQETLPVSESGGNHGESHLPTEANSAPISTQLPPAADQDSEQFKREESETHKTATAGE
jgi:hypothetical protein